jgi:hypothetical protein
MAEIAAAYGVHKKGWDALSGVAAVIQRELPDDVWDKIPEESRRFRLLYLNVRMNALIHVLHPLMMDVDSFESLKAGRSITNDVRKAMDVMVVASFRDGGAHEFVDIVLANIAGYF